MRGIPDPGGVSGTFAALARTAPQAGHSAAELKWSVTRTQCGSPASDGHPCGRAVGHKPDGHVCRCEAEQALQTIGVYVARVAS